MENGYKVVIEAIIKQVKDSQVIAATKNLKPITIDVNLGMKSAKEQIAAIQKSLSQPGDKISTKTLLDVDGMKQYSVGVEHVASGLKTSSTYIADINKAGEVSVKQIDSMKSKTGELNLLESRQLKTYEQEGKILNAKEKASAQALKRLQMETEAHKNLGQTLANNAKKVAEWAISTALIYGSLQEIRKAMEYIVALNKEMTNIGMVTGQNTEEMAGMLNQYQNMARELGVDTLAVVKGAEEWIRQGKTAAETIALLRSSTMMSKLGNLEAADATDKLIAVTNAYNISAENSIKVVDTLINLDNRFATSTGK